MGSCDKTDKMLPGRSEKEGVDRIKEGVDRIKEGVDRINA
jgi:hypothetical protein